MPNLIQAQFWSGSFSPVGKSPFGYFDSDNVYYIEAPQIANWIAISLGWDTVQVELTERQMYSMIEESITEYGAQVNEFLMRENMLSLQGYPTSSDITQQLITGTPLPFIISISQEYGSEAGAGGNVDYKMGYITLASGSQEYDLQNLWAAVSESGNRIEIKRVFHDRLPAIDQIGYGFGDLGGFGPTDGTNNLLAEFGWGGLDGGLSSFAGAGTIGTFIIMPIYETLLREQSIQFNNLIRRSNFSFEIRNNKLKLYPIPWLTGFNVWFEYIVVNDRNAQAVSLAGGVTSDYSNAPYLTNITYSNINVVGRRWIKKYALALAKINLGRILSKYESIPSPGAEVRLDGPILRQEGAAEREELWKQLRETLEQTGKHAQLEKSAENEENIAKIQRLVPNLIYIG